MTAADQDPGVAPDAPAGTEGHDPRPRLALGDPLARATGADRPESWGDRAESDADRLAHYEQQRPPHHGD